MKCWDAHVPAPLWTCSCVGKSEHGDAWVPSPSWTHSCVVHHDACSAAGLLVESFRWHPALLLGVTIGFVLAILPLGIIQKAGPKLGRSFY